LQASSLALLANGATTIYIRDTLAEEKGLPMSHIAPRTVMVANNEKTHVNGVVAFNLQLVGLPTEKITTYTLPLSGGLDLILGLM